MASARGKTEVDAKDEVTRQDVMRFGFVLLPEFPLYALVPAMEALRIANQHAGRRLFDWRTFSIGGGEVRACSGMSLTVDSGIADVATCECAHFCRQPS